MSNKPRRYCGEGAQRSRWVAVAARLTAAHYNTIPYDPRSPKGDATAAWAAWIIKSRR